jgi:hypothetical protein
MIYDHFILVPAVLNEFENNQKLSRKAKTTGGSVRLQRAGGCTSNVRCVDMDSVRDSRLAYSRHNALATRVGKGRTCVEDAIYCGVNNMGIQATLEHLRSMHTSEADTPFSVARLFLLSKYNVDLKRISSNFMHTGGIEFALLQVRKSCNRHFVLHLRIANGDHDLDPDYHCVYYNGSHIVDNQRYASIVEVSESHRLTKEAARAAIGDFYVNMGKQVRLINIYELCQSTGIYPNIMA